MICREYHLDTRWTCFPLHPDTPETGQSLEELFKGRLDIAEMMNRLSQVAASLDLPFGERMYTYNSRRAQELGKWAEAQGCGEPFHQATYHAYFAEGQNIGRIEILQTIAEQIGLDPNAARNVVEQETYAAAVDADWRRSREMGITGVPTVVYQNRKLVGFAGEEAYRRLILD